SEHLLYALTFDEATAKVLRHAGADVDLLRRQVADQIEEESRAAEGKGEAGRAGGPGRAGRLGRLGKERQPAAPAAPRGVSPRLSLGLRRSLEWAGAHAEAAGKSE